MALNYTEQEKNLLKKFLVFTFLIIFAINILFTYNSSTYRVSKIVVENVSYQNLVKEFMLVSKGDSIWTVSDTTFNTILDKYDELEGIEVTKNYPNSLSINLIETKKMAIIFDLRKSIPETLVLLKNASVIAYNDQNKAGLASITISNGPVPETFYGELVSFIATLDSYNLASKTIELNFSGSNLVGDFQETTVDFGYPIDLGKKASALGYFLQNNSCNGDVSFIGSEELITNCNI